MEFDRASSLRSIPASFGIPAALRIARVAHVAALLFLGSVALVEPLHGSYFAGLGVVAALFVYEHSLVKPGDLSKLDAAFFTVNGWVGVLYLVTVVIAGSLK